MRRLITFLAVAVLSLPFVSSAQESPQEGTVLADVNLSNATIVQNDRTTVKVSLDIENRSSLTQPDIRYGIELIRTTDKGQEVVDTFIANESVSLAGNRSVHKEISYPVPLILSGDFEVWAIAKTTGGLMLGHNNAGKVTLSASGDRVSILPDSCRLKVSGDDKDYFLSQGVDVSSDETLSLVCTVKNGSSSSLFLVPYFDTFRRNVYGDKVSMTYPVPQEIALDAGEQKDISVVVPMAPDPQAYDASVVLMRKDIKTPVSEKVIVHYVLRGASATIQNVSLDKDSYAKGDTVNATLFITPSADGFPESRAGQGTDVALSVVFSVADASGVACIDPQIKTLESDASRAIFSAPALIDCDSPNTSVVVKDENGNILDSREIVTKIVSPVSNPAVAVPSKAPFSPPVRTLVIAVVAILFLSSLGLIAWQRFGKKGIPGFSKILVIGFVLSGSLLFGAGKTEAVTWVNQYHFKCSNHSGTNLWSPPLPCTYGTWNGSTWGSYSGWKNASSENYVRFTVNTDKTEYSSGENILLSASSDIFYCNNVHPTTITATSSFGSITVLNGNGNTLMGSGILVAPTVSTPTVMTINLIGDTLEGYSPSDDRRTGVASIDITIVPASGICGTANGVAVPSAPTTNLCSVGTASAVTGTGPWSWTCLGPDPASSADDASCSAPKAPTLRLCVNGADISSVALSPNETRSLKAYYDAGTRCSGNDVTASAIWTGTNNPNDAVALSGTDPKTLTALYPVVGSSASGQQHATEVVTASHDGQTDTITIIVNEVCMSGCAAEAGSHCQGESFTSDDSCGVPEACSGTRSCDMNWKEVVPGL